MRPRPEDRQRVTGSTLGQQSRPDDHFSSGRRLHGVSFEELVGDLSEEQRAQLRALLELQSSS